jgi:hypothetical protein
MSICVDQQLVGKPLVGPHAIKQARALALYQAKLIIEFSTFFSPLHSLTYGHEVQKVMGLPYLHLDRWHPPVYLKHVKPLGGAQSVANLMRPPRLLARKPEDEPWGSLTARKRRGQSLRFANATLIVAVSAGPRHGNHAGHNRDRRKSHLYGNTNGKSKAKQSNSWRR